MFSKFSEEVRKALVSSKLEMKKLKHPYVGSEHLLLAILKNKKSPITKRIQAYDVDYENFKNRLIEMVGQGKENSDYFLYTPLLRRIIEESMIISRERNHGEISLEDIMTALFNENEGVAIRVLSCMNINIDKLSKEFTEKKAIKTQLKKKFIIEEYGYDMNQIVKKNEVDPVIGRDKEIERLIEILCRRSKNNPLLIGEAGVGKTAIVEELSRRIVDGLVPDKLKNKKIISISMASLIAGTKYRGEFEERITKMLSEIENSTDIILFIDEIHTLVGAGGAEGAIDASNILKPFLARGKLRLIGATTIQEYKKYLEDDRALERRFQIILIKQPNNHQVLEILKKLKPIYENYHNVELPEEILKSIVELSEKYIYNRNEPDKSIDILDEICSRTSLKKSKEAIKLEKLRTELNKIIKDKNMCVLNQNFAEASNLKKLENKLWSEINKLSYSSNICENKKRVSLNVLAEVIKSKTNIPIYEIVKEDLKKLNKIELQLNKEVIGQENVISQLSKDIKRVKLGYKFENKPRSYLFAGPTGVGKTLLAKELNKLISNEDNLIRLDMSEYKEEHSVSKIIGAPPGYVGFSNKSTVLDEVKIKPNAVILLDEIERAHSAVVNLFLQILDEGKIKSSTNELIRFDNTIIIMTSNVGYTNYGIGFNGNFESNITTKLKECLGSPIINRIDKLLFFDKLDEKSIRKIVIKKIEELKNRFEFKDLKINKEIINKIIKMSKFNEYGARKIDKIIKNELSDMIIEEKLNKNVNLTMETI